MSAAEKSFDYTWPDADFGRIPDWIYTSDEIYQREQERIFQGPTWNFVGFEAEVPEAGDFRRSYVGTIPVIVSRAKDGEVYVFENRCRHRGVELCRDLRGKNPEFICPYHQWTYDLNGDLIGVPFRRGMKGQTGMPKDFDLKENGLVRLNTATRGGVVFASFSDETENLDDYLGPEMLEDFDATFDGRAIKILGYWRNRVPANWKLYHENLKDPYHASLLHTYLVNFNLMTPGQKSGMTSDATGRHGSMASAMGDIDEEQVADGRKEMRKFREGMELNDRRVVTYRREFESPWSVTMMTIWPNLIVQRELNTLGIRQIVPRGTDAFDMYWIMFGFEGDDAEMTELRLCQSNLMGPAGHLGAEDNEAIEFVQEGVRRTLTGYGTVRMGGDEEGTTESLISESCIRSMYRHYAGVMGLS